MVEVAAKLRKARKVAKHDLHEAAAEIGCSHESVRNWERNHAKPHRMWSDAIQRYLARHLGDAA